MDHWVRFVRLTEAWGCSTPEAHLVVHLACWALVQGNPVLCSTFLDESLNKTLKRCLRLCHQSNFEPMAFCKVQEAIGSAGRGAAL